MKVPPTFSGTRIWKVMPCWAPGAIHPGWKHSGTKEVVGEGRFRMLADVEVLLRAGRVFADWTIGVAAVTGEAVVKAQDDGS